MGRTKTDVAQHVCSRCRNPQPICDFSLPGGGLVVPILLDFIPGKAKRSSAPEDPRKRQDVGARPRHHRWRVTRCKSKGFMATLPRSQQLLVNTAAPAKCMVGWATTGNVASDC